MDEYGFGSRGPGVSGLHRNNCTPWRLNFRHVAVTSICWTAAEPYRQSVTVITV